MARTNVGKPQYKRPERKSAARKSVEIQAGNRTRQILLDAELTRRVAKGQTTKMLKGFYMPGKGSAEYARQADSLKQGVIGGSTCKYGFRFTNAGVVYPIINGAVSNSYIATDVDITFQRFY